MEDPLHYLRRPDREHGFRINRKLQRVRTHITTGELAKIEGTTVIVLKKKIWRGWVYLGMEYVGRGRIFPAWTVGFEHRREVRGLELLLDGADWKKWVSEFGKDSEARKVISSIRRKLRTAEHRYKMITSGRVKGTPFEFLLYDVEE